MSEHAPTLPLDSANVQRLAEALAWRITETVQPVAPRLLTAPQVASYLGLALQTVRNRSAEIPGRKCIGRRVVFDRLAIDRWIEKNNGIRDLWLDARQSMR